MKIFDWLSIVFSFVVFFFAWLNANLTDLPWHGLCVALLLGALSVLAVFALLEVRGYVRVVVGFGVLLLLLSIPSVAHVSFVEMSVVETILFYAKQVYLPVLAIGSLLLSLRFRQAWRIVVRWAVRVYAVFGIALGIVLLYYNVFTTEPSVVSTSPEVSSVLSFIMFIGIVLTVFGLILNPLYAVWRVSSRDISSL